MLQNYIGMSDCRLDVNAMMVRERVIRSEAEQQVFKKLSGGQRIRFRLVLSQLRKGVGNREKLRFARTRICGMIRQLLNAAGEIMAREGVLDHDQEIYYLTLDEVWDYIKGTAVTANLRSLVEVRQSEYDSYCHMTGEVADIFSTYGMAYNRNTFKAQEISVAGADCNGGLHGISCSPGRVKGTARVVHSPHDDMRLNRQILVAARTDPGWLLLYPALSAILIEHGSILSHAAIVAREMAIPAIIGIPGLMAAVSDGSQLIVDATAGTVNLA